MLLTISGLVRISAKTKNIKNEIVELENEVTGLSEENKELASQKKYYNSTYFIEKEARLQLNMKKVGEEVVFIDYNKEVEGSVGITKDKNPLVINFLDWLKYFFKDKK